MTSNPTGFLARQPNRGMNVGQLLLQTDSSQLSDIALPVLSHLLSVPTRLGGTFRQRPDLFGTALS